jgi:hypothetical protein
VVKSDLTEEYCQRVRRVGAGEVNYKRVLYKPARVAQGSYRAENEISGGARTKMAALVMYHKGSNHRDRDNPGKSHGGERGTKQVRAGWEQLTIMV